MFTTRIADGSKENLQELLHGEQSLQYKKAGDENGKESTVNYRAGETYGMAG